MAGNTPLLRSLLLPSLQSLKIKFGKLVSKRENEGHSWPQLTRFLQRSRPPLTEIMFHNVGRYGFGEAIFISCLPFIPTLRSLDLTFCCTSDELFRSLTIMKGNVDRSHGNLCPELTEIRICSRERVASLSAVAKMALSRSNAQGDVLSSCQPLALLQLRSVIDYTLPELESHSVMERCVEAGLDLFLGS